MSVLCPHCDEQEQAEADGCVFKKTGEHFKITIIYKWKIDIYCK